MICPYCQRQTSDPEFCDHCNLEIRGQTVQELAAPASVCLPDGRQIDCSPWNGRWPADPDQAFPVESNGRRYRMHGLKPAAWQQRQQGLRLRSAVDLAVLPPVAVLAAGAGTIVVADAWPDRVDLADANVAGLFKDDLLLLEHLLPRWRLLHLVLGPLHEAGFVWLNFDPGQLEVSGNQVRITNLDLQLFPKGQCPDSLRVSRCYSPPEVWGFHGEVIGPATDVFHLSLYAYYSLAGLLPAGFPGNGLEAFHFEVPPLRVYRPTLPPGVAPVLERGLARDPAKRWPSTAALLGELEAAVDRARHRADSRAPLSYDAGGTTRAGRAKSALGLPNQDTLHAALVGGTGEGFWVVADGVSHALLGRGEVASQAACRVLATVLEQRLPESHEPRKLENALASACLEASREIVRLSNQLPSAADLRESDVMSSTALIAVVCSGTLTLAHVGDSRAYLINGGVAEQLTVDGDVGHALLAAGLPPEQVREMGPDAGALRSCLGTCRKSLDGTWQCDVERSTPRIVHWPLQPGDVLVLCSDGLVEEGIFLEPAEVASITAHDPDVSALVLAERLADAADARQRPPSPAEPGGLGDNITCVVLKVLPGPPDGPKGP